MKLKEILRKTSWSGVALELVKAYPEEKEYLEEYEVVYNSLLERKSKKTDLIIVIESGEDEYEEGQIYYDVYGIEYGKDEHFALDLTHWSKWLGMKLGHETIKNYSPNQIVAHCLYEMTFLGRTEVLARKKADVIRKKAKYYSIVADILSKIN